MRRPLQRHTDSWNAPASRGARLGWIAFILALALVLARATVMEIVREPDLPAPNSPAIPRDAGPATGLIFDAAFCLPALLILLRGALEPRLRLRCSPAQVSFLLLGLLAALSVIWASDKFLALVNAAHLVAAATLFWSASYFSFGGTRRRLLAGAAAALLLIYTAHGLIYRYVDVPDNIKYWTDHRAEELAQRNWQPDSFEARQFELKLQNGEMIGFSTSPNTFAAMIVLLCIVTGGAIIQRCVERDEWGWPAALAAGVFPALWVGHFAQSKAAAAGLGVGVAAFAGLAIFQRLLARRRTEIYWLCAGTVAAGICAIIVLGVSRGNLFTPSLTFRWQYWVGALRVFERFPLLGVGFANFGQRYLAVRLPMASEEVKDPHNLLVKAFVELGVLGGVLTIGWLARLGWEATRPVSNAAVPPERQPLSTHWQWIFIIALAASAIGVFAGVNVSTGGGWYAASLLLNRLLYFGLMLLGLALVCLRSSRQPLLDGREAIWVERGIGVGVAVFLIQNLIDFSFFEPAPMMLLSLLAGSLLARPEESRTPAERRWPALLALGGCSTAWVMAILLVVAPLTLAENEACNGDDLIRGGDPRSAFFCLSKAASLTPASNADYAFRAGYALQLCRYPPEPTTRWLDAAISLDPADPQYHRARASFEVNRAGGDIGVAVSEYEKALALDPNQVQLRLEYASALQRAGHDQRAAAELQMALRFNDLLDPTEPKRLRGARVEEIQQKISALQAEPSGRD